jgi:hypothetical protein
MLKNPDEYENIRRQQISRAFLAKFVDASLLGVSIGI